MSSASHSSRNVPAIDLHQLGGLDALGLGGPLDLEAVLVGAGEVEDLVAEQAVPPGEHVARDRRVGVTDVGHVVHVIDGRRHVEAAHGTHCAVRTPTARSLFTIPTRDRRARRAPRRRRRRRDRGHVSSGLSARAARRARAGDRRSGPAARRPAARSGTRAGADRRLCRTSSEQAARELAAETLRRLRDGEIRVEPTADPAALRAMMEFALGEPFSDRLLQPAA